jgi:hypothetical protein
MKHRIKSIDSFKYAQVYRVLERKNGQIYRTQHTGRCVIARLAHLLGPEYVTCSFSTNLTRLENFEIDHESTDFFKEGVSNESISNLHA